LKKAPLIAGVEFSCLDYREVKIPDQTLIYCDIPYQGTTQYGVRFDHNAFWQWADRISRSHPVIVSEYARNAGSRRVLATRRSTCFMSDRHTIPTQEVLILLSPRDRS
jgi:site-specific DNA-adenine methylase